MRNPCYYSDAPGLIPWVSGWRATAGREVWNPEPCGSDHAAGTSRVTWTELCVASDHQMQFCKISELLLHVISLQTIRMLTKRQLNTRIPCKWIVIVWKFGHIYLGSKMRMYSNCSWEDWGEALTWIWFPWLIKAADALQYGWISTENKFSENNAVEMYFLKEQRYFFKPKMFSERHKVFLKVTNVFPERPKLFPKVS